MINLIDFFKKKKSPRFEFRVGDGLNDEQTKTAYQKIREPDYAMENARANSPITIAKETIKEIPKAAKDLVVKEFSIREEPVEVRRMFEVDPVLTKAPPIVTQLGTLGNSIVEFIPRAAATAYGEFIAPKKNGRANLGFNAKRLGFEESEYKTAAQEMADAVNAGESPWIAGLRITSEKTLDISFGAQMTTQMLKVAERSLLKGGLEAKTAAWETLGRPATMEEATANRIAQRSQALEATKSYPLKVRESVVSKVNNALNKAEKILKEKGLPTAFDRARMKAAGIVEVGSRETNLRNYKEILTPDLEIKKVFTGPEVPAKALPGMRARPGQAPAFGLSTKEVEKVGKGSTPTVPKPKTKIEPKKEVEPYKEKGNLTTSILKDLEGRTTVSKQYILDATNRGELKQIERDVARAILKEMPDNVDVKEFAKKVQAELLPLKRRNVGDAYESVNLSDDLRGDVENYSSHIYESPIKTSAGSIHFNEGEKGSKNYFGHTRVEDVITGANKESITRRVIEVQSDLYQKGNLARESKDSLVDASRKGYLTYEGKPFEMTAFDPQADLVYGRVAGGKEAKLPMGNFMEENKSFLKDTAKLQQYNDPTAHFRMVREEIKKAAQDGKTKLQFPTGETAMKIEGLGDNNQFYYMTPRGSIGDKLKIEDLKVGQNVGMTGDGTNNWIITDVLGDGKFKAIQKVHEDAWKTGKNALGNPVSKEAVENAKETFDISGKVDTNNPIYKFYEKDLGRYLKNKYQAVRVTDNKGVTWYEVDVKKDYADKPVEAFAAVGGIEQDEEGDLRFNPFKAALGVAGFTAMKRSGALRKIDELIAAGKVRVVSRNNRDIFQIKKGDTWVNARDEDSAVKQLTEKYIPKPKVYAPVIQEKIEGTKAMLENVRETLKEHPAKPLLQFIDKKEGEFLDFRNPNLAKTEKEAAQIKAKNEKIMKTAESSFQDRPDLTDKFDNPDTIKEVIQDYKEKRIIEKSLVADRKWLETMPATTPKDERTGIDQLRNMLARDLESLSIAKTDPRAFAKAYGPQRQMELEAKVFNTQRRILAVEKSITSNALQNPPQIDVSQGMGRSIEIQGNQAQAILDQEPFPINFSYPQTIEDTGISVKKKVNIVDSWLRSPEAVMRKIGFEKEYQMLLAGADGYWKELPKNIEKIDGWLKRLKNKEAQKAVYQWLDGQAITLPSHEKEVGMEIKAWMKEWAERLKLPEDDKISYYITHIFSKELIEKEFDENLAKIISGKIPKGTYDPFLLHREGVPGYIEDLGLSLDAYVKRATRKVHMDPALEAIQGKAGVQLEFSNLEKSQFKYVQNYIENINMRPTEKEEGFDNFIKSVIGYRFGQRPVTTFLRTFRRLTFRGMLGLNPTSALRNLSQGINTYATLKEKYTTLGYIKMFNRGAQEELVREGVLNAGFVQDRVLTAGKKAMEKLDKVLFSFFDTAERINRGSAYFGAKSQFLSGDAPEKEMFKALGGVVKTTEKELILTEENAIKYAKYIVRKTQFSYDSINTPVAISGDIAKTFFQFQTFTVKQTEFLAGMAKDRNFAGLIRYALAGLTFVYTVGRAFNMDPKELLPWPRLGVPPSQKLTVEIAKAIADSPDKFGNDRSLDKKVEDIGKASIGLIPAGAQGKKTLEGITAIQEGGVFTKDGKLQYKQGMSVTEQVQAVLFGKYASNEAQDYFNRKKIKEKEQAPIKKIYDQAQKLKAEGKEDEAIAIVENLSEADYEVYKDIRTAEKTKATIQGKKDIMPTYLKVQKLVTEGKEPEAQAIVDALSDDEYRYYKLIKDQSKKDKKATAGEKPEYEDGEVETEEGLIKTAMTYAKALGTDPVTAFNRIFTGQRIRYVANGAIVVERLPMEKSQSIKSKRNGNTKDFKLDHLVPLQLGGSNAENNLVLVSTADWEKFTPVENFLGQRLRKKEISKREAQKLIKEFKEGKITAEEVYNFE